MDVDTNVDTLENELDLVNHIDEYISVGSDVDRFTGLLALQELMNGTSYADVKLEAGIVWEKHAASFEGIDDLLQFLVNLQHFINELTWLQYDVLLHAKAGGISQNQLAAALGVSAATVSQRAKAAEWISPKERDYNVALSVAHAAINTKDSGLSPLDAYKAARDSGMSARQVQAMIEEVRPSKPQKMSVAGSGNLIWKGHTLEIIPEKFSDDDFTLKEEMPVKFTVREA